MKITLITLDTDYLQSDEWSERWDTEEGQLAYETVTNLVDWNYNVSQTMTVTVDAVEIEQTLQALKFPFTSEDITSEYVQFTTSAPYSYDGFGTLTVSQGSEGKRIVAARKEHASWQTSRYMSGLYSVERA